MTAFGSSPQFNPTFIDGVAPVEDLPSAERPRAVTFPGRWVGGAVGALSAVIVAVPLVVLGQAPELQILLAGAAVCALGIPIAFVLGRHLAPVALEQERGSAFTALLTFALLAPLLGDIEVVFGPVLIAPLPPTADSTSVVALAILLVGVGAVVSFVAVPATFAVGLVWVVILRAIPADRLGEFRAPIWLERFGIRHAVVAFILFAIVARTLGLFGLSWTPTW
jgi:hypothetical protein